MQKMKRCEYVSARLAWISCGRREHPKALTKVFERRENLVISRYSSSNYMPIVKNEIGILYSAKLNLLQTGTYPQASITAFNHLPLILATSCHALSNCREAYIF